MPHFTASEKSAEVIASGEKIELDRTLTVLLVGVGGQGTILAGSLLAMAAADAGLDVARRAGLSPLSEDQEQETLDKLEAITPPS